MKAFIHQETGRVHIIAPELPIVGETFELERIGKVKVVSLYYNARDNFIVLLIEDCLIPGERTFRFDFTIG